MKSKPYNLFTHPFRKPICCRKDFGIIEKMPTISKDLVNHLTVSEHDAGQRLDNHLIKILKGVPKSHIHRIIRAGEVRVNKGRAKPDTRI